jgi:hypothetical protein
LGLEVFFVDDFFAVFNFRARAARAFAAFWANFARASGESRRRFFATVLVAFFALFFAVMLARCVLGARPTAGRTSAISTSSPRRAATATAAMYSLSASTISVDDVRTVTRYLGIVVPI